MNGTWSAVAGGLLAAACATDALAQRRGEGQASGEAATVIYRQDFEAAGATDFTATGYGSVNFLKATMPEAVEKAKELGCAVRRADGGASGSRGCLEVAWTGGDKTSACAERTMDWPGDGATVLFHYRKHGVGDEFYVQAWGRQASKNLHAELDPAAAIDQWQVAKVSAESLVGFGGGAFSPGEKFGNLMFVLHFDASVKDASLRLDNLVIYTGRDGVPPSKPASALAAKYDAGKGCTVVTWAPAEDDVGVYTYEVYRGDAAGVETKSKNRVGSVCDLAFEDRNTVAGQTYYYKVVAKDAGGNKVASDELVFKSEQPAVAKPKEKAEF